MKLTPAQLRAKRKYYSKMITEGHTQLNVLIKVYIVSSLKQYAINNSLSIQDALSEILIKALNIPDKIENNQEKPLSSWD